MLSSIVAMAKHSTFGMITPTALTQVKMNNFDEWVECLQWQ